MTQRVCYEWDVETFIGLEDLDTDDIIDHHHCSVAAEAISMHREVVRAGEVQARICLIRDTLGVWNTVEARTWAYVEDGVLPERFDDGTRVPKRFAKEWERARGLIPAGK